MLVAVAAPGRATDDRVAFAAIGDLPYHLGEDFAPFLRLIEAINAEAPAFTVHVGDIKSAGAPCSDESYGMVRFLLDHLEGPWVYTPGDNEWTDCQRKSAGRHDPFERLDAVRATFFPGGRAPAREALGMAQQSDGAAYPDYVENARWDMAGTTFVTLHVVGGNDNWGCKSEPSEENRRRGAANLAWLAAAFEHARSRGSASAVVFIHADPLRPPNRCQTNGFTPPHPYGPFLAALKAEVGRFAGPVLLVHGDNHVCRFDQPISGVDNLWRAEVFGAADIHGLLIAVQPDAPTPFAVTPLIVPGNAPPGRPCLY